MPGKYPMLQLRGRANTVIEWQMKQAQDDLFQSLGVICPLIRFEKDESIGDGSTEFVLNGETVERLGLFDTPNLTQHAPDLVTEGLVDRYLGQLTETYPDLVRVVKERFPIEGLTALLREKVAARVSIRNLPSVLEDLLAESPR